MRLLQRCKDDDRVGDITASILEASTRTPSARKLHALGRALALGYLADDDAALDELELMLAAVRDLENPHIKVLDRLVERGRYEPVPDLELAAMFRNGVATVYTLLKTLERHGLAGPTTAPSADPDATIMWSAWDFGIALHSQLLRLGVDECE